MRPLIILLCTMPICGCGEKGTAAVRTPAVEVWLDQPLEKVKGVDWPRRGEQLADMKGIDSDAEIIVHFPSGRKYSTFPRPHYSNKRMA